MADVNLMARYDFRSPRLYVAAPLGPGATVALDAAQSHYLTGVLRLKTSDRVLIFNGADGEWEAHLAGGGKRSAGLLAAAQVRPQTASGDLLYLFAPLKRARLDYMVQKAVEMGVSALQPVLTRHTMADRVNLDRMRANAIEAAEQCGILGLPEILAPLPLERAIAALPPARHLVFCDEAAEGGDPVQALRTALDDKRGDRVAIAVLIGPEGGFAEDERAMLARRAGTTRIALGPRILRADTAAVAALAIVQAAVGDWR